jgi:metacaspase-1
MVKYALLVGLNYPDEEKLELKASYNDVLAVEKYLIEDEGFDNDHILILTDKKIGDNKENLNTNFFSIVRRMKEMVALSNKNDILFFYFTGHGTQIKDNDADESDYNDEVFLPSDHVANRITDDLIKSIISVTDATVISIFDCCNSGSMCDLKYKYTAKPLTLLTNLEIKEEKSNAVCISSCNDNTLSYEKVLPSTAGQVKYFSLFTYNLLRHMTEKKQPFSSLLVDLNQMDNTMQKSTISFSHLDMKEIYPFTVFVRKQHETVNFTAADHEIKDKLKKFIKANKFLKKDLDKKNALIERFKNAMKLKGPDKSNNFNSILYSLHE